MSVDHKKNKPSIAVLVEEWISRFLLAVIVLLVFVAGVTRYLGAPINWSVDIAQALFVWVIFLGANQALRSSRHIGVDLLLGLLNPAVRLIIVLFHYCLMILFLASTVINGIHISIINAGRIIQDIPISYSFVTMAVPVGSLLMIITSILNMKQLVCEYRVGGSEKGDGSIADSTGELL